MKKRTKIILIVVAVLLVFGIISSLFEKDEPGTETPESDIETQETVTEPPENETGSQESQAATGNPLLDAELIVEDVMNGTWTEKIGEYAYVTVDRETMKKLTENQYADFCENVVQDSGYNWITIDFGDGYGIQFQGSIPWVAAYGSIDADKCILEQKATIMKTGEEYEYVNS